MKKMWKLNNKAVSPVIATILMVAITVVLAAVLYVMVMGFGGEGNQSPTASLNPNQNKLVISISDNQDIKAGMSLSLLIDGTPAVFPVATTPTASQQNITVGTDAGPVNFVDAGADGKINTGDYFVLDGVATGATIALVWSSGGANTIIAEGEL